MNKRELHKSMKMSELVEINYHLLGILSRLGIKGSFSDRSVEEICRQSNLDPDTFIVLCTVCSDQGYRPSDQILTSCETGTILKYLHGSHEYYLNSALADLSPSIEKMIAPTTATYARIIRKFFEDYRSELVSHFAYEENTVIPYVRELMRGVKPPYYSIANFRENHSNIEESLSDLKNLIMQSLPPECDGEHRIDVLSKIFHLQDDLEQHTYIEDAVLVPLVEIMEGRRPAGAEDAEETADDERPELISEREKEVLVLVAKGLLNKEIADKLNISINTVITHRKNITRKIGIKTVPGLTAYAILEGLIDINDIE